MSVNKKNILLFIVLIVAASLYRVFPGRPLGFAPQIAMALFAGSVVANKKLAIFFPLFSLIISDAIYQVLYLNGFTEIEGFFYEGQLINYILFSLLTVIGFYINSNKIQSIFIGSVAGVAGFYLLSNFGVWIGGLDLFNNPYPKTFQGLTTCYTAGLPFLKGSFFATIIFGFLFFGIYNLFFKNALKPALA